MAYDTLIDKAKEEAERRSLADVIRAKGRTAGKLTWGKGFEDAVKAIDTALPTQEKTVSITTNGTTEITPDVGKTLAKVVANVNVIGDGVTPLPPALLDIIKVPLSNETAKTIEVNLSSMSSCIVIAMFSRSPVKIPDGFTVLLDGLDIEYNQKLLILYRMVKPSESSIPIRFENDGKSRQAAMVYTFSNCGVPSYQESNNLEFICKNGYYRFSLKRSNCTNARLYVCHFALVGTSLMRLTPELYTVEGTYDDSNDPGYFRLYSFYSYTDFNSIDAFLEAQAPNGSKGGITFIELPGVPAEKSSMLLSKSSMSLYERDSETLHTIEEVL